MTAVGVVGAGRWGKNLVRTLGELGALAAVCDENEAARSDAVRQFPHLRTYVSLDDLLADEGVGAVAIASPAPAHYNMARRVIESGRDVFVEKPIALVASEARELAELAKEENRILMAGHLLLFQPAIGFVKQFIERGDLGAVRLFHQVRKNLGTIRFVENVVMSLGIHDIAVADYLTSGSIPKVSALGRCVLNPGIEDEAELTFDYENGIVYRVSLSWLWPEKDRRLVVYGSEGFLELEEETQEVFHTMVNIAANGSVSPGERRRVAQGDPNPLRLEMQHFLECVRTRTQALSEGFHAARCVETIERVQEQLLNQRNR